MSQVREKDKSTEDRGAVDVSNDRGLQKDALSLKDIIFSAVANIGPALSLFAVLAVVVASSGGAGPATILIGMAAILVVANSLVQFARHTPTAGSFVTWIEMGLGPSLGRFTLVVVMLGYLVALSGVLVAAAGVTQLVIGNWSSTIGSWVAWMALFTVVGIVLLIRGVKLSTNVVVLLFAFEALVLVALAIATIVGLPSGKGLSAFPFSNLNYGAMASALPLVVLMFVGWENAGALSEEAQRPRRNVGLSVIISVVATGVIYAFVAYAAELGFPSVKALSASASPLDTLAGKYFGGAHSILDFAILTSALSLFLAASNSQARILFNAGRTREFPRLFSATHRRYHTPYAALSVFVIAAFGLGAIWTGLLNGKVFTYVGVAFTLSPLLLMVVYALLCVALPVYYWREHRDEFNWLLHVIVPAGGIAILVNPFYESVKPIPGPLASVPWATLIGVVAAVAFAVGRSIIVRARTSEDPALVVPSV